MKALRLPTCASAVAYLFRFRRPRDPSSFVFAEALLEGGRPSPGPGSLVAGHPSFRLLHVDASGISQVSRRSAMSQSRAEANGIHILLSADEVIADDEMAQPLEPRGRLRSRTL
jgi:hypothetical protein